MVQTGGKEQLGSISKQTNFFITVKLVFGCSVGVGVTAAVAFTGT